MGFLLSIWILIKVIYPSDRLEDIIYYNQAIDKAMKQYCFLDIEYELTPNTDKADLIIYTYDLMLPFEMLGLTHGSYVRNPKLYGIPNIHMNAWLYEYSFPVVLTHELGHFFGLDHSIDPNSLMYPEIDGTNITLTRHDSLSLLKIYKNK